MALIIDTANTIATKLILCEYGYASHELAYLIELLLQEQELLSHPRIMGIIEKMMVTLNSKNYVYLADIIAYELIPVLKTIPLGD